MSLRSDNFRLAYRSLKAAKARSFLTMLGIIIGVMAVVLITCIGEGVKRQISGQLTRYGDNVVVVQPNTIHGTNFLAGFQGTSSSLLTENDFRTTEKTAGVKHAVPIATVSGTIAGDHTVESPFMIATTSDFGDVINQKMESGGFFDANVDEKAVVLGHKIALQLFDDNAPLGQALTWRGERFIVAGVFEDFKAPPFSLEANYNDAVFVPYAAAQAVSDNVLGIYQILVTPKDDVSTDQFIKQLDSNLISTHGGSHDASVTLASQATTASDQTLSLLTILVAGAALIALIVGGVGIMDVMLVSVTERMHEIGIRKAIGATNQQIMRQFVAEAFVISAVGALIGLMLSAVIIGLMRLFTSLQPVMVWPIFVIAPLVAIATGLFFGSMPALKAARKDPIEALRHE